MVIKHQVSCNQILAQVVVVVVVVVVGKFIPERSH
jgi:hypothetical protein